MVFEKNLNEKYVEIAKQVSSMIPVEWQEFYLYGEAKDGSGETYFYFKELNSDNFIYSEEIYELYGIDEKVFDSGSYKLFQLIGELKQIFIEDDQEPWFSIMMYVDEKFKLQIEFDYINWLESDFGPVARTKYFAHHYLGVEAKDQEEVALFEAIEAYKESHN